MATDRVPGATPDSHTPPDTVGSQSDAAPDISRDALDTSVGANHDLEYNPQHTGSSGGDYPPGNDLSLDDALLGALNSMSPDMVSIIDHTLDHLTTAADLFDVPAVDFHDVGSS
jgi:hypothetical protein